MFFTLLKLEILRTVYTRMFMYSVPDINRKHITVRTQSLVSSHSSNSSFTQVIINSESNRKTVSITQVSTSINYTGKAETESEILTLENKSV